MRRGNASEDGAVAPQPSHDPQLYPERRWHGAVVARDTGGIRQVGKGLQTVSALVRRRALAAHYRDIGSANGDVTL